MPAAHNLIGRQCNALDDILFWFQLKSVPGVGNLLLKRLIERFGTPAAALSAARAALLAVEGVGERLAEAIMMLAGDRERGQRFGENGFNRLVNEFHIARNIEATQRLYERILGAAS